ncbi:WD repeat-containing protein 11 [Nymphaea thermarum]|nr:WD repeat-containing protein 11 [Nymphaea thermarum]
MAAGAAAGCMLAGPASRNNGGCCDCSSTGLLAYGAGSSVVVVDTRSMQLVCVIPMPPPSSSPLALAPFVTSVRWIPNPLHGDHLSDDPSNAPHHLRLAVGDRQGRIGIFDARSRLPLLWMETFESASSSSSSFAATASSASSPSSSSKPGIQDLCFVRPDSDTKVLASLNGSSVLSLWNPSTGRCFWKYDVSPEFFSCMRVDPFDSRHLCALGLKGFLLSIKVLGEREDDVIIKERQISVSDSSEIQRIEKDAANSNTQISSITPAFAAFPLVFVKFCFSPHWKHILYAVFPRELLIFDMQYETALFSTGLPRGCSKFLDVMADVDHNDRLYCAHIDGKISVWRRNEGEQVHLMCFMEELMPSLGNTVPSPNILAVTLYPAESVLENVGELCSDLLLKSPLHAVEDAAKSLDRELLLASDTFLISISDDGKIWKWLLTAEGVNRNSSNMKAVFDNTHNVDSTLNTEQLDASGSGHICDSVKESETGSCDHFASSAVTAVKHELVFKVCLVGHLHLLSSTLTVLAAPCPSLTATLARGGNSPAACVPLVALGTQGGMIDVVDVAANAVATSLSVHGTAIKGLRWLGNSRLVSFSYSQVNDKGGGYINRLVVSCLRSGLHRPFRVLQKPERAPVRALRASSSGRYLLLLFRDAPVEVWAMTKNPMMLRSLALPFTIMEWTLPTAPRPSQKGPSGQSSQLSKEQTTIASSVSSANANVSSIDSKEGGSDTSNDETSESFAFALVNGAVGVFEVQGRRIRDFRPKWPSSSFVSSDGLVTAMAYRLPHVVMGDRSGSIRWWDVTTGLSSSFNTHRDGIRRIKFSPVVSGDHSRGRIAVLFHDNTFSIFDLDTQDPLANALLQPQFLGTLVLELDWLLLRTDSEESLALCIAGADSSFRLIEVCIHDGKFNLGYNLKPTKERFRPMPLCSPVLLPTPHALVRRLVFFLQVIIICALKMILQLGVKPSWFEAGTTISKSLSKVSEIASTSESDLRRFMIESANPQIGDSAVPEMLLKVLEPYRKEGCLLDNERVRLYAKLVDKGYAVRFAFAALLFGDPSEALFWLQLPHFLYLLTKKSLDKLPHMTALSSSSVLDHRETTTTDLEAHSENPLSQNLMKLKTGSARFGTMAFEQCDIHARASERIPWHEKFDGEDAIQKRVHE